MGNDTTILAIDDDSNFLGALEIVLDKNYKVITAQNVSSAMKLVFDDRPDLILLDVAMPDVSGIDILRVLNARASEIPVIMLTGNADPAVIVESMRLGATDYVVKEGKDFGINLNFRIEQALKIAGIKKENHLLSERFKSELSRYEILGPSASVIQMCSQIAKFKGTKASVLIRGPNGTGKELVARNLHLQEGNLSRPFVAVNCSSVVSTLFESEFFGHVKGAFSGALSNKDGYFVSANGGDIFLDEIGDIAPSNQAKLLRALQEKVITPVGSSKVIPIDVRVIGATNRNLEEMVENGDFREDLYYRINKLPLSIPALKDRKEDILFLAEVFAKRIIGSVKFSKDAQDALLDHSWPGNIRELSNVVEYACVLIRGEGRPQIRSEHLKFSAPKKSQGAFVPANIIPTSVDMITPASFQTSAAWMEKAYIQKALELLNGDNKDLISRLGISKAFYYKKKKDLGLLEERELTLA